MFPAEARTKERMIAYVAADAVDAEQPSPAQALAGGKALLKLLGKIKSDRAAIRRDARAHYLPADGESEAGELRALVEELIGLTELGERPCAEFNPPPKVCGKRAREAADEPITAAPAVRTRAVAHDEEDLTDLSDEELDGQADLDSQARRAHAEACLTLVAESRARAAARAVRSLAREHESELEDARTVAHQEGWTEGYDEGCARAQVDGLRAQLETLRGERDEREEMLHGIISMLQDRLDDSWEAAREYVGKLGGHVYQTAMGQHESAPPAGIRFMSIEQLQQLR